MEVEREAYLIEQASVRAKCLVRSSGVPVDGMEDAKQNLLLDCLRRLPKFDSSRGDFEPFVRGVMRNHSTILAVQEHRRRRRDLSLDEPIPDRARSTHAIGVPPIG